MSNQQRNALSPESYLTPHLFITEYDGKVPGYAQEQQRNGMQLGQDSHTIMIDQFGLWFAYKLDRGMVASGNERIGVHANTADLLRGFLASPASIVIQRFENGARAYHCIKQCNHPSVVRHIFPTTVFDLNLFAPMWRETTEEQYEHYLNCVPPVGYRANAFLSGEPYTHDGEGRGIYLAGRKEGERYFVKLMTAEEFRKEK